MKNINMYDIVGDVGEDKDAASTLRKGEIIKLIGNNEEVALDFQGVTLVTQSFVHALISDVLRVNGEESLDLLEFRNCTDVVKGIVQTVVQYSLDSVEVD